MARPSPAAVAAIRSRVADWSSDNKTILAAINAPALANPAPRGLVPKPLETAALLGKVGNAGKGKVYRVPGIVGLQADIKAGDRRAVKNWFALAAFAGDISPAEMVDLTAEVDATIPDPDYRPLLSWAEIHIGRALDLHDLAEARPH